MKIQSILLLTWKKFFLIIVAWVVAFLLHNFVYGLFKGFFDKSFGGDEPFFFLIAIVVIPIYVIVSLIYTIVYYIKK